MTFDPADHPRGDAGRFVTAPRSEAPVRLTSGPAATQLYDIADELVMTTSLDDAAKSAARARAMAVLAPLPDAEARWQRILTAAERWVWFEDETDGDLRAGEELDESWTLDVDLEDHAGYNEADRHDEDGYMGYDFRAYADALADAWRSELVHQTRLAEQALAEQRKAS